MKKYITLILCIWMLASCQDSWKGAMLRLVSEWQGKEIKFPARPVFTIQGKDTVNYLYKDADYKVVTYVDSVGCTSCKLQLHQWKKWITEVDSLTGGRVPFLFFFHPKDIKELRYLTRREDFTYPVCLDSRDELNRLNRFPSDITFQTLLLDKENKVVALGNPILNPRVKELYQSIMMGTRPSRSSTGITQVSIDQTELDFGSFAKSEKQERSLLLTNTGNAPLVIQDITTSCGCTKVEYRKEPVRPGGTLELKISYEAEETGHFNKTVTVYCNAKNSPLRLMVKGNVKL